MTNKEQIIIQGKLYNPCNGCELWEGEYCTGDKSYEPNGKIHSIICDRHMAEQFWKVRNELIHKAQECEELKKANLHIDTNRQCKGKKLKRIDELISACGTGYTDEVMQKIYGIIQEPEPTINDYSITDRYRKALEEIEKVINNI